MEGYICVCQNCCLRLLVPARGQRGQTLVKIEPWSKSVTTRFSPREGFEDLVFTSKTNNPINAANIKDSINYIVDRINRENPEQLDQNATAPTAR